MSAAPKHRFTVAEYLARERTAEHKSEFFNGEIFAMPGASPQLNIIKDNLIGEIGSALRGSPCRTFPSDQRVKVDRTGLFTYPDIVIVCGQPRYDADDPHTLVNPQVVIEVLSPTTEAYDRGAKFRHYQQLPSVREYVLVSQEQALIERFERQLDDRWLLTTFAGTAAEVSLGTVAVRFPMQAVYAGVELPSDPPR